MRHTDTERFAQRIDKMVEAGRITKDEARRLRAAGDGRRDKLIRQIRLRHVHARLDEAVDRGGLTREEADEILGQLAEDESPRQFARRLRGLRGLTS